MQRSVRIACEAPCDFGCVMFLLYLFISFSLVAIDRLKLDSQFTSFSFDYRIYPTFFNVGNRRHGLRRNNIARSFAQRNFSRVVLIEIQGP